MTVVVSDSLTIVEVLPGYSNIVILTTYQTQPHFQVITKIIQTARSTGPGLPLSKFAVSYTDVELWLATVLDRACLPDCKRYHCFYFPCKLKMGIQYRVQIFVIVSLLPSNDFRDKKLVLKKNNCHFQQHPLIAIKLFVGHYLGISLNSTWWGVRMQSSFWFEFRFRIFVNLFFDFW